MESLVQRPASYLQLLELSKLHFSRDCVEEARSGFQQLVATSMPAAPDVWLEAAYGLGECSRVTGDFASAIGWYRRAFALFGRGLGLQSQRLWNSNRVALAYSCLALIEIGRLTLRVPCDDLLELIECGMDWTFKELKSTEFYDTFRLQRSLLRRNVEGPFGAAQALSRLLAELQEDPFADAVMIEIRLAESLVDARQTGAFPATPPLDHWAFFWAYSMLQLQRARRFLAEKRFHKVRAILRRLPDRGAVIEQHPDLYLLALRLNAEAASRRHRPRTLEEYRQAIYRGAGDPKEIGDASTCLWHLSRAIVLQLEPLCASTIRQDCGLLHEYLTAPWIEPVLRSRGWDPYESRELKSWTSRAESSRRWAADGIRLLTRFRQLIRP